MKKQIFFILIIAGFVVLCYPSVKRHQQLRPIIREMKYCLEHEEAAQKANDDDQYYLWHERFMEASRKADSL